MRPVGFFSGRGELEDHTALFQAVEVVQTNSCCASWATPLGSPAVRRARTHGRDPAAELERSWAGDLGFGGRRRHRQHRSCSTPSSRHIQLKSYSSAIGCRHRVVGEGQHRVAAATTQLKRRDLTATHTVMSAPEW